MRRGVASRSGAGAAADRRERAWQALVDLCRGRVPEPAGDDAAELLELARAHQVDGTVGSRLVREPDLAGTLPDRVARELVAAWRRDLGGQLLRENLLGHCGDVLDGAGIDWLLLKGAWIQARLYPDEPGRRAQRDLDLLLRRTDVEPGLGALAAAGYALPPPRRRRYWLRSYFHVHAWRPGRPGSAIELHWDLEHPERHRIDLGALWRRAPERVAGGRRCRGLCDEDLFCHLALHLAHGLHEPRLRWVLDLAAMLELDGLDWEAVARRAARWRLERVVALGLAVARRVCPELADTPGARRLGAGAPPARVPAAWQVPYAARPVRGLVRWRDSLRLVDRRADRARFLARHAARKLAGRAALVGL